MNRDVGTLISFQPNAQKIVDNWNIASFHRGANSIVDEAFRALGFTSGVRLDTKLDSMERPDVNRMVCHRQDLYKALERAAFSDTLAGPPARITMASKVIGCGCKVRVGRTASIF